jgi:hypothetical protein
VLVVTVIQISSPREGKFEAKGTSVSVCLCWFASVCAPTFVGVALYKAAKEGQPAGPPLFCSEPSPIDSWCGISHCSGPAAAVVAVVA